MFGSKGTCYTGACIYKNVLHSANVRTSTGHVEVIYNGWIHHGPTGEAEGILL